MNFIIDWSVRERQTYGVIWGEIRHPVAQVRAPLASEVTEQWRSMGEAKCTLGGECEYRSRFRQMGKSHEDHACSVSLERNG